MFEGIFETIVKGSNTVFLDLPEEEYILKYKTISMDSAQSLAEKYFENREKRVLPKVQDLHLSKDIHRIKITVELENLE